MDLKVVEDYTAVIKSKKTDIEELQKRIQVLSNLHFIDFKGNDIAKYNDFRVTEETEYFGLSSQSLDVFKTLAIKELGLAIREKEKELAVFIKKGIPEGTTEDKTIQKCSNCNKGGAF